MSAIMTTKECAAMLGCTPNHFNRSTTQERYVAEGMPARDTLLNGWHRDAFTAWIDHRAAESCKRRTVEAAPLPPQDADYWTTQLSNRAAQLAGKGAAA